MRLRLDPALRAALAALALAAVSAGAEAQTAAQNGGALRGYQVPDKAPAKAQTPTPTATPAGPLFDPGAGPPPLADISPIPRFQDDPAPRFSLDPAPRTQGLDLRADGAACRTSCAETRYQCRASDDADICDRSWSQCVSSCAESSSAPL